MAQPVQTRCEISHAGRTCLPLGLTLACVVKSFDASVQFLVQFVDLLACYFVVTFPDLLRDFVDLR
jgi:hypothetical protein